MCPHSNPIPTPTPSQKLEQGTLSSVLAGSFLWPCLRRLSYAGLDQEWLWQTGCPDTRRGPLKSIPKLPSDGNLYSQP